MGKMESKNPKVYVTNDSNSIGSYNLIEDSIGIFHGLDKFPKLKKWVLEHELKHAEEPKTLLTILKREYKDYSRIYETDEYWEYRKYYQYKEFERGIWWHIKFTYFYVWAVSFIYSFSLIRGLIINKWRRWKNE